MSSHVEQIKERLSINEVLGSYIKIEKAGANFKARCPFHNEKTPSFFISPGRNSYYCFGCGAKGDILNFVQEFEGLDFMGALKVLADRAGVSLKDIHKNKEDKTEREKIFQALEHASVFFQKNLWEKLEHKSALTYLTSRGLTSATIKKWNIGFALDDWRSLHSTLKDKGFSDIILEKAGLIKSSDTSHYDRFRSRITFPLFDTSGRVIGFSGRIFENKKVQEAGGVIPGVGTGGEVIVQAKYLNSPETEVFSKSHFLYGAHIAKNHFRHNGAILVEGQMDLIMSHQSGYENTVGVSGTALTEYQLAFIKRFTDSITMVFDPDNAGVGAALRASKLALSMGFSVKVGALPKGQDPADCLKNDKKVFDQALKDATHIIEFYTNHVIKNKDGREVAQAIRASVLPLVAGISSKMEQSHFVKRIHDITGLKEDSIWSDLEKTIEKIRLENPQKNPQSTKSSGKANDSTDISAIAGQQRRKDEIEKNLLAIIFWKSQDTSPPDDIKDDIKNKVIKIIGQDIYKKIEDSFEKDKEQLILEAEIRYEKSKNFEREVGELLIHLETDYVKAEFQRQLIELEEAERQKDKSKAEEILKKCKELSDTLSKLPKI